MMSKTKYGKGWLMMVLLATTLLAGSCELLGPEKERRIDVRPLSSAEKATVTSGNHFGFKLFGELQGQSPQENLFISPLSVSMALGMTLNGAAGETYEAMRQALEKSDLSEKEINEAYRDLIDLLVNLDPKVVFQIANSIWYREGFSVEQTFLDVNKTYFDAEVRELDFGAPSAVDVINGWIDSKTKGKIKKVIEEIGPYTVMYLINAIYFKGAWTYEFDKKATIDDVFRNANGTTTAVKMMRQEASLPVSAQADFSAIDLPYGDSLFSMTILLPDPGEDVNELAERLSPEFWDQVTASMWLRKVEVQLPRFKLEYSQSLVDVLRALGMGIAFTDEADFTRIRTEGGLLISDVIHKTFVEVNEEGTEAAAVTVVQVDVTSIGPGNVFRVDRPFIFAIRERHSGTVLFLGKVMKL